MKEFELQVVLRDVEVEGLRPWVWPMGEEGLWAGPREEIVHLKNLIIPHVKNKGTIVQAGGACGMYPRIWAEHFATVYTFEPDPLNFFCLTNNCQTRNIHKFNAALSSHRGLVHLSEVNPINRGEHTMISQRFYSFPTRLVQQIVVDDLQLEECDALQLDVEGAEAFVLNGAEKTIDKFRPVIAIETCDDDCQRILQKYDYRNIGRVAADTVWVTG